LLHILVTNKRRSLWLRWLDKTANYARCFVEFKDPATREVLLRIDGRWASGPQPLAGDRPDTATIFVPQREILVIDEPFPVDVALKYSGHTHFYAFNNRSYLGSDDDPHLRGLTRTSG
jgi:hypothetical protein